MNKFRNPNKILHNYDYDLKFKSKKESEAREVMNNYINDGYMSFLDENKGTIEVWVSTRKVNPMEKLMSRLRF